MARIANFTSAGTPTDPTGGMTLDALMARQKMLAEAGQKIAAPRDMQSPWQGAAMLAQTFANSLQEGRTEDKLAAGRDALAKIRAGIDLESGPTSDQISQASLYDPSYADNLTSMAADAVRARRAEAAAIANREDQQTFQAGQQTGQQEFTAGQTTASQDFTAGQTTKSQDFTAGQNDLARQAAIDAAKLKAAEPNSPEGKIMFDFKNGAYGDPTTPEAMALRDAAIKRETTIPTPAGVNADRKALWDQQDQYVSSTTAVSQLNRASALLKQGINTGYTAGLQTMAGKAGVPFTDPEAAKRTNEYNSIMTGEAITAMSQALKGATTDTEMARFIEIMNDPTVDPTVKQRQIDTMIAKAQAHNELQAQRIKELGGDLPTVPSTTVDPAVEEAALAEARAALAKNAPPELVRKRLVDKGFDPGKL